jgi:hypothetical protein
MRALAAAILLGLGTAANLQAQRLAPPTFPTVDDAPAAFPRVEPDAPGRPGVGWLIAGGLIGGAVGTFGGAWTGAKITEGDCEDCFFVGAAYGAVAGVTTGVPLGVHVANRGRGNLSQSLLLSAAIGAAGLGLAAAADEPAIMFAVPALQLAASVAVEREAWRR